MYASTGEELSVPFALEEGQSLEFIIGHVETGDILEITIDSDDSDDKFEVMLFNESSKHSYKHGLKAGEQ